MGDRQGETEQVQTGTFQQKKQKFVNGNSNLIFTYAVDKRITLDDNEF